MKPTDPFVLLGFGEGGWGWTLMAGTWVTVQIAVLSYLLGLAIGLIGAWAKLKGPAPARFVAEGYTTVVQGLPDILVILIIYYGGTSAIRDLASLVSPGVEIEINAFAAGVTALAVICGTYTTGVFRAAFMAVPRGQSEAALALGLHPLQVFAKVTLPQAMRLAAAPLGNVWLVTLKDAALISVVGIRDLVGTAASGAAYSRQPFTFYMAVAAIFLVLSLVSMGLKAWVERRAYKPGMRA
ncbi:ABC transporter permease [Chthonobacter albigriseus]|uniref:ABC transporter permease n=1 Tax=Chthonobacter albigriseus TaxID=1683161 RepID=UPI0015EECA9B|nr:ABC transporter permease subunit [Chthonobacter albigriseus]